MSHTTLDFDTPVFLGRLRESRPNKATLTMSVRPYACASGIISISRYRDIDRQPHIATISWDRLRLRYRADATRLILMDGNSTQTDP